jgi:hypothetical protein
MSKGKYKRKHRRAQQKAQEIGPSIVFMKQEERAQEHASVETNHRAGTAKEDSPMLFIRVWGWIRRNSSFTDWCIAAFTLVLAFVAIYQYNVMNGQLGVMRNDERAWLQVKVRGNSEKDRAAGEIPFNIVSGQQISIPLDLSNIGKTPAKEIVINVFAEVPASFQGVRLECVDGPLRCPYNQTSMGIMFPSDHTDVHAVRMGPGDQSATDIEAKYWTEGKVYAAAYGIVTYEDVFNVHHWTKFCFFRGAEGGAYNAQECTSYNAAQ